MASSGHIHKLQRLRKLIEGWPEHHFITIVSGYQIFHSRVSFLNDNLYDFSKILPTTEQKMTLYYTLKVREMQFSLGIFNISHIVSKYTYTHTRTHTLYFCIPYFETRPGTSYGQAWLADWPLDAAQLKHPPCTYFE